MLILFLLLTAFDVVSSQYDSSDGPVFSSCGSDITVDKGVITSPEYPGDYPNNLMCRWRVLPQVDGIQIRVVVVDLQIWESYICSEDFLRLVFQGKDARSYRLCGNDPQDTRNATHFGPLEVYLRTDRFNVSKGFKLKFEVLSPCLSEPCRNGGRCSYDNTSYTCQCADGWEGVNCQTEINECQSAPCQNGGTCSDNVNRFFCACPIGVTGDTCDVINDRCAFLRPCANGGTCRNQGDGHVCACAVGYTGSNCDAETDECASNPCFNGGRCNDMFARYMCDCVGGYTGERCETAPTTTTKPTTTTTPSTTRAIAATSATSPPYCQMTSSITCLNGGSCVVVGGAREACLCANGFEGQRCENFAKDSPDYLNALIATSAAALICILLMGAFVCLILCKRKRATQCPPLQLTGRGQPNGGNYSTNEAKQQTPREAWGARHHKADDSHFIGRRGTHGNCQYDSMMPGVVPRHNGYNAHYHGMNGFAGPRPGGKRRHSVVDDYPSARSKDEKLPHYDFDKPTNHTKRNDPHPKTQHNEDSARDRKKKQSGQTQPTRDVKIAPDAAATLINYLSHALKRGIPVSRKRSRDKSSSDALALKSVDSDETTNQKPLPRHVTHAAAGPFEKPRRRNYFHAPPPRDVDDDVKMSDVKIYDYFDQFASDKQGRTVLRLTRENAFLFE